MDLFSAPEESQNLLPSDGEVIYHGIALETEKANAAYQYLRSEVAWRPDEARIFGKHYITGREVAWYGDQPYSYKYSGVMKEALPWNAGLVKLKRITEKVTKHTYNSCLLNLYHDGSQGMAWHSDGEKMLEPQGAIASFSFGAERIFQFKHKESKQIVKVLLQHGSLLVMKGTCQQHWLHRLPPSKKITRPRISLTFRTILT